MKKPIQISIPTPCHENWDAMTPADKGRFCASCQKTVFDFTNSSDREIASILKNTNNACGRFRATQLDRDLVVPKEKSTIWMAASAAIVSFLTIGNHTISAQTPVNTEQHVSETDEITGKIAPITLPRKIITGIVREESEGVLPGANIININTGAETQTDINGNFSIEAAIGDKLQISYVGIPTKEVIVSSLNNTEIIVEMEWQGLIVTEKKRTFFGRMFHSIGNWFR